MEEGPRQVREKIPPDFAGSPPHPGSRKEWHDQDHGNRAPQAPVEAYL